MKLRIFLFILIATSTFKAKAQQPTLADFDLVWNSNLPLSEQLLKVDSMAGLLDPWFTNLSKIQVEKALKLAIESKDNRAIAYLELSLGSIFISLDIIDSAQIHLERALDLFDPLNEWEKKALLNKELSWLYLLIPHFDKSLEHGLESLELYEKIGDAEKAVEMEVEIAFIHLNVKDYHAAYPFLNAALEGIQDVRDPKIRGYLYERFSSYYIATGDTLSAIEAISQSLIEMDLLADKSYLSGVYIGRGQLFVKLGRYNEAESDYALAKKYALESNYFLNHLEADRELGALYVKMGRYEEAIPLTEGIIKKYEDEGNNVMGDYIDLYQDLADAYLGLKQYEKAFFYQSKQEVLEDSIYTLESNRNLLDMQTKYETEKKESLLRQKQLQLYYSLGGGSLLLLMAGLLWRAYSGKRKQNTLLEKSNEEKAFLIKEIHHRVKNNLQVLSSLLSLQSDYIEDPSALDAVMEGRNRVQSMGLIHQKLYMGDELASVIMAEYIQDLTEHLLSSFGIEERVKLEILTEVPPMDVDTAIPLGLIINELVTNSLKYAFPNNQVGHITIHLWINDQNELCLKCSDNGQGLPTEVSEMQSTSFGTDLIKILSKKLKGKISVDTQNGYSTLIQFSRYNNSLKLT